MPTILTPADVAETQLGVVEATGHNDGVPADRYMRGDRLAWCAGFVLFCYDESDYKPIAKSDREYYAMRKVSSLVDIMKARGVFFGSRLVDVVERDDLVFYGSRRGSDAGSGNHVGIVVEHAPGVVATHFTTIEGNYGDKVSRRVVRCDESDIIGFARPRLAR